MTEEKIIEGNSIIALFMGFNQVVDNNRVYFKVNDYFSELINYKESETFNDFIRDKELKFHSDWNWIMLVVEKINTIAVDNFGELYVVIYPTHCSVREGDGNDLIIKHTDKGLLIDAVWLTVVEFIKWYNEQPKNRYGQTS